MLKSLPTLSFPRKRESRLFLGFLDARLRGHDEWVEGVVGLTTNPLVRGGFRKWNPIEAPVIV